MTNDSDLLERRSADELRFLKDHVEKIRSDPKVAALASAHEDAAPRFTLEALQSGVLISGYPCRLTTGSLALLRSCRSRCLGFGKDESDLTDYDIALAVFLMAEETRNEAVSVADNAKELRDAVKRFSRTLHIELAAVELLEYLRRVGRALWEPGGSDAAESEVFGAPDDGWSDDVDLLAHEYGWSDEYILWELPVVRIAKLKTSIVARREGKPRQPSRAETGIALLKAIEDAGLVHKKESEG